MEEITKAQIQESLDIAHVDEKAYFNELHFESYKYDQLTSKLVEVHVDVFQRGFT
jgi:hypothetical protein